MNPGRLYLLGARARVVYMGGMLLCAGVCTGCALQYLTPPQQNDFELVLAAVRQDGAALEWASEDLQVCARTQAGTQL